jgi:hypothetical protein
MITNKGKTIIGKFLLGQTTSYASHIAVGCGATPLLSDGTLGDYSTKTSLDYEMFRVPIVSRGYIFEDGIDKLVVTAELPTEERFEITELGLYSAGANPTVLRDSKQVFLFSTSENWEYHGDGVATALPIESDRLDRDDTSTGNMSASVSSQAFFAKADNEFFNLTTRLARQERPRYLNDSILSVGNLSGTITTGSGVAWSSSNDYHMHLTNLSLDLDKNASTDELRLAFSVINKNTTDAAPATVTVYVEFANIHDGVDVDGVEFAQFQYTDSVSPNNRYIVATKQLGELYKTAGFTWSAVTIAKVYVSVGVSVGNSADYYVTLDGMRLENLYAGNPLYGLTGYSVVRNTYTDDNYVPYAKPVIKNPNTSNYVEFRFGVDVE